MKIVIIQYHGTFQSNTTVLMH